MLTGDSENVASRWSPESKIRLHPCHTLKLGSDVLDVVQEETSRPTFVKSLAGLRKKRIDRKLEIEMFGIDGFLRRC